VPPLPDIKSAEQITAWLREIVRSVRHSSLQKNLVLFALLSFAAAWLVRGDQAKQFGSYWLKDYWQRISESASLALLVIGALLLLWAIVRIWREVSPPPESIDTVRPTVIKGPMAFGPHDAEIFSRLGRENEKATLLNYILDEQIGLIVVKGDSGAGKTSLLRAGLPRLLAKQIPPIAYHYWEAAPDQTETGLLNAVQSGWVESRETPVPQQLSDLNAAHPRADRRVIVLDQFEQLSPSTTEHAAIFQLLKHAAILAVPPHRIIYIVAFRADYSSTWLNFEYDELGGRTPLIMPLRLLSENRARDIIAVISDAAGFTMDNALVDDLVAGMKNEEDRISPVDIGITLLALNERALTKESRHLDKGDYRIAGGATGLLADYISSRVDRYPANERGTVVQAMLELADLSNDKRLAKGLSPDELAGKVGLPVTTLQRYLNDLASPQMRLLEFLSSSGAYRLSHERLIPALRQLAGLVLARAEQAGRMFDRAYGDWIAGQGSWRLLLGGRALSDVVKYRAQLHWAMDRDDKEAFLKRSLTWRMWQRALAGAAVVTVFGLGYLGWYQFNVLESKHDLENWRLPTALIDTDRLTALNIKNDRLTHLRWLHCGFKELSLTIPKVDDIEDLRLCRSLVSLALDLYNSSIGSLDALKELTGLNTLTLNLGFSNIDSLDALKELKSLKTLSLNLRHSSVGSLDALKELKGLNTLTLDLRDSNIDSLNALKELTGLNTLTLNLGFSEIDSLDVLKELKGLNTLTLNNLNLGNVGSLGALKELKGLNTLTLDLRHSSIGSLDTLKELKGLNNLALILGVSKIDNLDALKELIGLEALSITCDLRYYLVTFPQSLRRLVLSDKSE
jgi:transcriptional regulator with XRE-family HTH domain